MDTQKWKQRELVLILFYAYVLQISLRLSHGCMNYSFQLLMWWIVSFAIRKLLSWAWLTSLFFMPELLLNSASSAFKVKNDFGEFLPREFKALSGAVTITCLMMANLAGYVIGPSGLNWECN
ncbi:Uncharacterized protein Rs2_15870 [Raphanus sativus]|nr:Uncharacterized protein Rs2_15870 [Raphanus sativus]